MKIATILGTRPEIIKLSPLLPLLDKNFKHLVIHTGQHYDRELNAAFFENLKLSPPKTKLKIAQHSRSDVAEITKRLLPKLQDYRPNFIIVQGDTNSALAGARTAKLLNIPLIHVEAGCRSKNKMAVEERNRIEIDSIAILNFAPDITAFKNLKKEKCKNPILVGNTGLDACKKFYSNKTKVIILFNLKAKNFLLVTLHRQENVDNKRNLVSLVNAVNALAKEITVVWPLHPRTKKSLKKFNIKLDAKIRVINPQDYLSTLSLIRYSACVLSDSGGIQEECAVINRPCFIARNETEWTRLTREGKNFLVGTKEKNITKAILKYLQDPILQKRIAERTCTLKFGASRKIVFYIKKFAKSQNEQRNNP